MNVRVLRVSEQLYFIGLLMLVAGLPVSLFLTSLSQFFLAASFLVGNIPEKFRRFFSNKAAVLITGIWFMHLIGMLWTHDTNEGFKDLRIKLPLLILPLIIAGNSPLSKEKLKWILLAFTGAVFCGTMVSMAVLVGIIHRNIYDIRDVFIFNISHIRFALFTCLCIFILAHYIYFEKSESTKPALKITGSLLIIWLFSFLIIVVSVTGIIILLSTILLLIAGKMLFNSRRNTRRVIVMSLFFIPVIIFLSVKNIMRSYSNDHSYTTVSERTSLGNIYDQPHSDTLYENGYPVWMYVSEAELRQAWNEISNFKYDSLDERGQPVRMTLIRFLTSKGFRKDASGVKLLSEEERNSIERGVANVNYQKIYSFKSRIQQIIWEIDHYMRFGNVSGHSVTQRFEFWTAATWISCDNFFTGVGTGDMPAAYEREYNLMNSPLDSAHRLRAHNQFLAILVAFGIFGLIYFITALFYPLFDKNYDHSFLFSAFFLISFLSMFSEDTLETQAGVTFFALFFMLLLKTNTSRYQTSIDTD